MCNRKALNINRLACCIERRTSRLNPSLSLNMVRFSTIRKWITSLAKRSKWEELQIHASHRWFLHWLSLAIGKPQGNNGDLPKILILITFIIWYLLWQWYLRSRYLWRRQTQYSCGNLRNLKVSLFNISLRPSNMVWTEWWPHRSWNF